ncbi:hypothetical protein LPJ61_004931, partial [Coemansia biformis]
FMLTDMPDIVNDDPLSDEVIRDYLDAYCKHAPSIRFLELALMGFVGARRMAESTVLLAA